MKTDYRRLYSRPMLINFALGISSGLPLLLIGSTLKIWLRRAEIDLTQIGFFGLAALPYTLKFLWAPFMDRFTPPLLGRRTGWILVCQLTLALLMAVLGNTAPASAMMAAITVLIAFTAASQDVVIDAYRRESVHDEEIGFASALAINGYRIGMWLAGGIALTIVDQSSWQMMYFIMAGLMVLFVPITLLAKEPEQSESAPRSIADAYFRPLADFFKRKGVFEVLLFILLYKVGDSMASDMFGPFYVDMGFTNTEIGAIAKTFGLVSVIVGGLAGGVLIMGWGLVRSLWVFGFLQAASTACFSLLTVTDHNMFVFAGVIAFENLASGMGTSAYAGFMGSLCNRKYTATQYALLSSLMGVPRVILGSSSGYLAKHMGWSNYFIFCALIAVPGMLMLVRAPKWQTQSST